MTRSARAAAVALAIAGGAAASAQAAVPADIAVQAGHRAYLTAHAVGVQVYTCDGAAWGPATPRATLYGENGKPLGRHYGGPTWEARDGSRVVARRDAGVTVDPTAIPWLRLAAVSTAAGADGDRLAHTTWIQRINTAGGIAPAAADCTAPGVTAEVPYSADYVFYKATGS